MLHQVVAHDGLALRKRLTAAQRLATAAAAARSLGRPTLAQRPVLVLQGVYNIHALPEHAAAAHALVQPILPQRLHGRRFRLREDLGALGSLARCGLSVRAQPFQRCSLETREQLLSLGGNGLHVRSPCRISLGDGRHETCLIYWRCDSLLRHKLLLLLQQLGSLRITRDLGPRCLRCRLAVYLAQHLRALLENLGNALYLIHVGCTTLWIRVQHVPRPSRVGRDVSVAVSMCNGRSDGCHKWSKGGDERRRDASVATSACVAQLTKNLGERQLRRSLGALERRLLGPPAF